ncbi:MAG: FAD-dependent oxidoreductase [Cyanobacteria bacterium SZAS LIN-3]|nr:FAD-dependent oxidoreductase [Cyanobacteria bacterium SZAS LIN-3]
MKLSAAACLQEPVNETRVKIPWWQDLSTALKQALDLPTAQSEPDLCRNLLAQDWDLIVVGAGVAGLATALEAARLELKVLCLEAGETLGLGATGRNAGIMCAGINMPIALAPQDAESGQLWRQTAVTLKEIQVLAGQKDSLVQVTKRGGLGLARSKTAVKRLEQEARARTAAGLNAHMIDCTEVKKMSGGRLNLEGVQAAICYPDEGSIQPLSLLAQLATDALRAGAKFIGAAPVREATEVESGGGRHWELTLADGGKVKSRALIRATGPTAAPTARIYALSFNCDLPADFPLFWDAAPYVYYDFRAGNGRLTASGGRYGKVGSSAAVDARYHANMAAASRQWLPELAAVEPMHTWSVDIEVAHDLVPHLTPLGKAEKWHKHDHQLCSGYSIDGLGALGVIPGIVLGREASRRLATSMAVKL